MRFRTFAIIVVFIVALIPVAAQDEIATNAREFTAGGRSHVIVYPTSAGDSPNAELVIEAVQATLPVYNEIWDVESVPVFIKVLTEPSPRRVIADAGRFRNAIVPIVGSDLTEERDVCLLTVYDNAETRDSDALRFTVAHEIAHCYQGYHIPLVTAFLEDADDWWAEGSAEWLATHVYDEATTTSTLANYQENFKLNHSTTLTEGVINYDAMYFWAALEQHIGLEATIAFLKHARPDPADYDEHLMSLPNPAEAFHAYGTLAAAGSLPYQPSPDELFEEAGAERIAAYPGMFEVFTLPFSFDLVTLELPPLEENQGISLTAEGLTALHMWVSVAGGDRLIDGVPLELCPATLPVRLVVSRTDGEGFDGALVTVDTIECETPAPEISLPECLIGTWYVTEFPPLPGVTDVAIVSGSQIATFAADGTVSVTTEAFTIQMTTEVVMKLTVDASAVVFRIDSLDADGDIAVSMISSDLGVAVAEINGTRISIDLNAVGGAVVAPAPLRFECGANMLFWYFMANGAETSFTLTRVE